jgi:hypothetical protein
VTEDERVGTAGLLDLPGQADNRALVPVQPGRFEPDEGNFADIEPMGEGVFSKAAEARPASPHLALQGGLAKVIAGLLAC